jgi:two-component system, NarL family, nitrate/nitrite response regulator NarL
MNGDLERESGEVERGETGTLAVLLVGEDPLARAGLAALLAGEPGIAVVGESAPGEEAAVAAERLRPAAALWDLGLEPRSWLERQRAAGGEGPPAVALLARERTAAEALAAGARGLLLREAGAGRMAAALRAVAAGLVALDPALAEALLRTPGEEADPLPEPLTPREVEVLQLLAQGLSNRAIADRLGISEHTAKFHVTAILGKLAAESRTDAVVRAARLGLVLL